MAVYKPLNQGQIDSVVSDFLGRHPDRSKQIDDAIARNQAAATSAAAPAAAQHAAQASAAARSQNRGANPSTQKTGKLFGNSPVQGIADFISTVTGQGAAKNLIGEVGRQATEQQGVDAAPVNPVQYALNLLSTPVYMAGEAAEGLRKQSTRGSNLDRAAQDIVAGGNPASSALKQAGEGISAIGGGAARGLAEGLGFRFDGHKAKTLGDVTHNAGVNDAVAGAVEKTTGNRALGDFAGGATGFAADMLVPIPGLAAARGLTAGVRGAAGAAKAGERALAAGEKAAQAAPGAATAGAKAAARGAETYGRAATQAAERVAENATPAAGWNAGKAAYEAQVAANTAKKASARAAKKATKRGAGSTLAEGAIADAADRVESSGKSQGAADIASAAAAAGDTVAARAAAEEAAVASRYVRGRMAPRRVGFADDVAEEVPSNAEAAGVRRGTTDLDGTSRPAGSDVALNDPNVVEPNPFMPPVTGTRQLDAQAPLDRGQLTATPLKLGGTPEVRGRELGAGAAPLRALETGGSREGQALDRFTYDLEPVLDGDVQARPGALDRGELIATSAPSGELGAAPQRLELQTAKKIATRRGAETRAAKKAALNRTKAPADAPSKLETQIQPDGTPEVVEVPAVETPYQAGDPIELPENTIENAVAARQAADAAYEQASRRARSVFDMSGGGSNWGGDPKRWTPEQHAAVQATKDAYAAQRAARDLEIRVRALDQGLDADKLNRIQQEHLLNGGDVAADIRQQQALRLKLAGVSEEPKMRVGTGLTDGEKSDIAQAIKRMGAESTAKSRKIRPEFMRQLEQMPWLPKGASQAERTRWMQTGNSIRPESSAESSAHYIVMMRRDAERTQAEPFVQMDARLADEGKTPVGQEAAAASARAERNDPRIAGAPGSAERRQEVNRAMGGRAVAGEDATRAARRKALEEAPSARDAETTGRRVGELLPNLRGPQKTVPTSTVSGILSAAAGAAARKPLLTANEHTVLKMVLHDLTDEGQVLKALARLRAASPAANTFLDKVVPYRGKQVEVSKLLQAAFRRRVGTMTAGNADPQLVPYLEMALQAGVGVPRGALSPKSLESALAAALGSDHGVDVASATTRLLGAKPADRPQLLKDILNANRPEGGQRFETFDDAIAAAIEGGVDPTQMRQMAQALGIPTRATSEKSLRALLAGRGAQRWTEVKAGIATKAEVAGAHGIDEDAQVAAENVNVPAVEQAAVAEAQKAAEDAGDAAPTPPVAPEVQQELQGLEAQRAELEDALDEAAGPNEAEDVPQIQAELADITRQIDAAKAEAGIPPTLHEMVEDARLTVRADRLRQPNRAEAGTAALKWLAAQSLDPFNVDKVGGEAWRSLSQTILNALKFHPAVKGTEGAARGEALYGKYMNRITFVEAYLRSHGVMPRLQKGDTTWYVSLGQVVEHLDPAVVKSSLFDLQHRLGFGNDAKQLEKYKSGLSVFPSNFGNGAIAAMRGGDEATILRSLQMGRQSVFNTTPEGIAAMRAIAKNMADPGYQQTLRTLHEGQEVIALAFANRAADDLVGPLASRFITMLSSYGPRADLTRLVQDAVADAAKIATDDNVSLVRDLYRQKSTNGLLGLLNDATGARLRADLRLTESETFVHLMDRQAAAVEARQAARKVDGGHAGQAPAPGAAQRLQADRNAAAKVETQHLDESEDVIEGLVDDLHGTPVDEAENAIGPEMGVREDTDLARVETRIEAWAAMSGPKKLFDKAGIAFDGSFGMRDAKAALAQFMTGTHVASQRYQQKMVEWAVGSPRLLNSKVAPGVKARLEQSLGRPIAYEELHDFTRQWWGAVAGHTARNASITDDELRAALTAGAPMDARNAFDQIAALPADQVDMALELKGLIDDVFTAANGPMAVSKAGSNAIIRELKRYGVQEGKLPSRDTDLAGEADLWKTFDFSAEGSMPPLDTLLTWHRALEASTVPQSVGATLTNTLSHKAFKMTESEAKAQGWRRLDTKQENVVISAHVDPDAYFPPEVLSQLSYAEHLLQQAQKVSFGNPNVQKVVNGYDYFTGLLKSSQTIWRPAHHVTSLVGDSLINVMAGVNPAYVTRAPGVLRAMGQLGDIPEDALLALQRNHFPDGTPDVSGIAARLTVRGKVVELTNAQVAQLGIGRGALVTARHARDDLGGTGRVTSALGRQGTATFRKWNPASHIDSRLGEFSATRDNLTRVTHFIHELESRDFRSLDEAVAHSADVVNKYHPTIQGLSHFEQKVARRAVYFYTWMRLTAGIVMKHAVERPKDITAVPLAQYELASQNGLDPNSVGNPTPTQDERVPSYMSQGLLGPTYEGGFNPLASGDEATALGDEPHKWGFSISAPQIDAIQSMFQGGTNVFGSLNPLISAPVQLLGNFEPNSSVKPRDDIGKFLFQQTGVPYSVGATLGLPITQKAPPKLGDPQEMAQYDATMAGNQARSGLNFLLGGKLTDYTSTANGRNARMEASQIRRQQLKDQGYSDAAIEQLMRTSR